MYRSFVFAVLLLSAAALAVPVYDEDAVDYNDLMKILSKPRIPSRYKPLSFLKRDTIKALSWENCAGSNVPIQMTSFTLRPDPVLIPGDITIGLNVSSSSEVEGPIRLQVTIQKRVLVWVTVPCGDLCIVDDICEFLDDIEDCPACQCPLPAEQIHIPDSDLTIPDTGLPGWLESGDYRVTIEFTRGGDDLGCFRVQFSLAGSAHQ